MESTINGYSLSSTQKQAWINKARAFNNLISLEINIKVDKDKLLSVLKEIVSRHEILRTSYYSQAQLLYPIQIINDDYTVNLTEEDITDGPALQQCCRIKNIQNNLITQKINLEESGLLGACLVKLSEIKYLLLLFCPPIASDLVTIYNIAEELIALYNERLVDLTEDTLQFVQYSEWQNEILEENNQQADNYWQGRNKITESKLQLPVESFNRHLLGMAPSLLKIFINGEQLKRINRYLSFTDKSITDFILTCWSTLLWHHLGEPENITLGNIESGRTHEAFNKINGLLSKSLPFNLKFDAEDTFNEANNKVSEEVAENQLYQDSYSFLSSEKSNLNICYEYYDSHRHIAENQRGDFNIDTIYSNSTPFNLKLSVYKHIDSLELNLNYHPAYYNSKTAQLIKDQLIALIKKAAGNGNEAIKNLLPASENEQHIILNDFNNTDVNLPQLSFIEQFESQAVKMPLNIAVKDVETSLNYKELNERANQFADYLTENYNIKNGIVAIKMKRSAEMIVFLLGIMKAGAAFLPIDNNIPDDRLEFILKDSGANVILFDGVVPAELDIDIKIIEVNQQLNYAAYNKTFRSLINADDTAYIIYTSGSTGRPKGTLIANRSFINYVDWVKKSFNINETDSTLLFSSIAFDLSYTSLWSSLLAGGTLYILEETTYLEPDKLLASLIDNKITYIKLTPSHFSLITEDPDFDDNVKKYALRLIVLGGEKIKVSDVEKYIDVKKDIQFVNHYGPTETTVGVVATNIDSENFESFKQNPVIGKPIFNNRVYILAPDNSFTAIGITGELCVSGAGVAKGYLNRDDLMKEKFIADPFSAGKTLYKTGDLARWLPDGKIQLIGRNDSQVKIRGYRIELGEIEKVLAEDENIQNAVVLAVTNDDDTYLKAFLLTNNAQLNLTRLRDKLSLSLADYMMPAYFITLDDFPLMPNGKINRKELLNLNVMETENELNFEEPKNATEELVAVVWRKILLREAVSTNQNFFNIGGNSLKLVKVFRELSKVYPNKLTLTDLFKYSTIQSVSEYLNTLVDLNAGAADEESVESFEF